MAWEGEGEVPAVLMHLPSGFRWPAVQGIPRLTPLRAAMSGVLQDGVPCMLQLRGLTRQVVIPRGPAACGSPELST